MLKRSVTEPASKVSMDRFLAPSGENGWNFVLNEDILPIQRTLPSPQYQSLAKKFADIDSYISTCLVQEVQRCCSLMADEQDVG